MTRPSPSDIDAGDNGWEAVFNDVAGIIRDAPFPMHVHSGDETDLTSTFAPSLHDRCLVWVNDTNLGWVLYVAGHQDVSGWQEYRPYNYMRRRAVTGTVTLAEEDELVHVTNDSSFTITLPAAANMTGRVLTFVKQGGTSTITLDGNASENINGATTYALTGNAYSSVTLYCTGTEWLTTSEIAT